MHSGLQKWFNVNYIVTTNDMINWVQHEMVVNEMVVFEVFLIQKEMNSLHILFWRIYIRIQDQQGIIKHHYNITNDYNFVTIFFHTMLITFTLNLFIIHYLLLML